MKILHAVALSMHGSGGLFTVSLPFTSVVISRQGVGSLAVVVFGRHMRSTQQRMGPGLISFALGAILCCLAYRTKAPSVVLDRLGILRAVALAERCSRILGVRPGAGILLRVRRGADVDQFRAPIAAARAQRCKPADVSAAFWTAGQSRQRARLLLPAFSSVAQAAEVRSRELDL
jgi:hypothetical protein